MFFLFLFLFLFLFFFNIVFSFCRGLKISVFFWVASISLRFLFKFLKKKNRFVSGCNSFEAFLPFFTSFFPPFSFSFSSLLFLSLCFSFFFSFCFSFFFFFLIFCFFHVFLFFSFFFSSSGYQSLSVSSVVGAPWRCGVLTTLGGTAGIGLGRPARERARFNSPE